MIKDWLKARGFAIVKECLYHGHEIREHRFFEKQYQELFSYGTLVPLEYQLKPNAILKFQKKFFPVTWVAAVQNNLIMNAFECAEYLCLSFEELNDMWLVCVSEGKCIKLDRGLFCAYLDKFDDKDPVFCVNGFLPYMQSQFESEESSVCALSVEWDSSRYSWSDFSTNIIGDTNPSISPETSLRRYLFSNWQKLHIKTRPNIEENYVHASPSAYEALVEKAIWFMSPILKDPFAIQLIEAGVPKNTIKEWCRNPILKEKPLFEHMSARGCDQSVEKALQLLHNHSEKMEGKQLRHTSYIFCKLLSDFSL